MCVTRGKKNVQPSEIRIPQESWDNVDTDPFEAPESKVVCNETTLLSELQDWESSIHEKSNSPYEVDLKKHQVEGLEFLRGKSNLNQYVDRAEDIPEVYSMQKRSRGGTTIPFPLRLHQMLDDVENACLTSIVSWRPHGRAFKVYNRDEFITKILPTYFHHNKFSSFQRQLNLYGFSRISHGIDKGVYYNEFFLKGRCLLASKLVRKKKKPIATRASSNPNVDPDFYKMKPLGPLKEETLNKIYDLNSNLITEHLSNVLDEEIMKMFASPTEESGPCCLVLHSDQGRIEVPRVPYIVPF